MYCFTELKHGQSMQTRSFQSLLPLLHLGNADLSIFPILTNTHCQTTFIDSNLLSRWSHWFSHVLHCSVDELSIQSVAPSSTLTKAKVRGDQIEKWLTMVKQNLESITRFGIYSIQWWNCEWLEIAKSDVQNHMA